MNIANLPRRLGLTAVAFAVLAVALPSAAQEPQRPDEQAQTAAEEWAKDLLSSMRGRVEAGTRIALQPLEPKYFPSLDRRQRQHIYEWIRRAFDQAALGFYELVDMGSLVQIADVIESSGASDWWKQYLRLLDQAKARINVVCEGAPMADWITMDCSAVDLNDGASSVGQAAAFFRLEWLSRPIALDFAIGRIASEITARIGSTDGAGRIRVVIVDSESGGESALSNYTAEMLADAIHERAQIPTDWIAVGTDGGGDARHRVDGEIRRLDDRLVLRVVHRSGEGSIYSVRENITLSSVPPELLERSDPPDPCGAEVGHTKLPNGTMLSDWALLAEVRLRKDEYDEYFELLVEAKSISNTFCDWEPAAQVFAEAVAGIAREIDSVIETDPRASLALLLKVLSAAGPEPALLLLKARSYRLLGEYEMEEAAYGEWLEYAPLDHPKRLDVLNEQKRVRSVLAACAAFEERLDRCFSAGARAAVDWTDLHYAAAFDLPGAIAALISNGMDPNLRLETGSLPFGESLEFELGDTFKDWNANGETPLMIAAAANAKEAMAKLLAHGADVEATSDRGARPLHHSAWQNAGATTALLLDAGANTEARTRDGVTPLHHAAGQNAHATVELLLSRGADVHAKDDSGATALHHAAWRDAHETAALLLDGGANVQAKNQFGATSATLCGMGPRRRGPWKCSLTGAPTRTKETIPAQR